MGDGLKDDPRMAYWMIGSGATDTDRGTTGVWTPCNFGRNLEVGFFLQVGPGTHRVRAKVEDIERDAPRNPVHVRRLGCSVVALRLELPLCRFVVWSLGAQSACRLSLWMRTVMGFLLGWSRST